MLALVKERKEPGAILKEVEKRACPPRSVLARVRAASICGTDLHLYEWNKWASTLAKVPNILGHEFAGEVVEVGSEVTTLKEGDMISAETHIYCGTCFQCRIGSFHLCENVRLRGINTDGCFAEYVAVSENTAWKNDPSLDPVVASAQEPFGNAVHSVFSGEVTGLSVVVFGCGPIGLCAIGLSKFAGADKVIAVDISDYRLDMARRMRADLLVDAGKNGSLGEISAALPHGADVILEMSGAPKALRDALKLARPGGRLTILGLPADDVSLDVSNDIVLKELTIQGIFGRKIFETWELASRLLKSHAIELESIITHRMPLSDYEEAFALMSRGRCGKIVFSKIA